MIYVPPMDANELLAKAQGIRDRWEHRPNARFQWRIGRQAFDDLVLLTAGPPPDSGLADLGPRFAAITRERERARLERINTGLSAWGKEGSTLFGDPIVCDETFDGIEMEIAHL